jgi:hypothetical protein
MYANNYSNGNPYENFKYDSVVWSITQTLYINLIT